MSRKWRRLVRLPPTGIRHTDCSPVGCDGAGNVLQLEVLVPDQGPCGQVPAT